MKRFFVALVVFVLLFISSGMAVSDSPKLYQWKIKYYVDEFRQPTSKEYIINDQLFVGSFNDSATNNSRLDVEVIVDKKHSIAIFLYKYGRNIVKNLSSRNSDYYDIVMLTVHKNKINIKGRMLPESDRIMIDDSDILTVISTLLSNKGSISFYIKKSDRAINNYLFTLEIANFAEEYKRLK